MYIFAYYTMLNLMTCLCLTPVKQQFNKLTEVENAVANLTASVVLLTSNQQDTSEILFLWKFGESFWNFCVIEVKAINLNIHYK